MIMLMALTALLVNAVPDRLSAADVKEDLKQIQSLLEEVHPNPYFHLKKREFKGRVDAIIRDLPEGGSPTQFFERAARLVADLRDGHTRLISAGPEYLAYRDKGGLLFPLELRYSGNRTYVAKNYGGQYPVVGTELVTIQGQSAGEVRRKFLEVESEERLVSREDSAGQEARSLGFTLFRWRPPYHVRDASGREYVLPGVTIETIRKGEPATNAPEDLRGCTYRILPNNIGYLAFQSGYDPEKFRPFVTQAFTAFKEAKVKALAIDVRQNPGGGQEAGAMVIESITDKPYRQFGGDEVKVSRLLKARYGQKEFSLRFGVNAWKAPAGTLVHNRVENDIPPPNPLRLSVPVYVLIGPGTFSNGMAFASGIKDCHLGTLVGEETGGLGSAFGQFERFTLKHSGFTLWVSVKHIFRPSMVDDGHGILPDVKVETKPTDLAKGVDPVLDKVVELVASQK